MLPPGLELITQEEAEQMARTTKRGTCELCGAHANVGMNHGSKVCPQCTHIQSALSKRPQSVANAIRAMGKTEELLSALIPAGGGIAVKMTADFLQEISGIVGYDGEDPGELVEAVRRVASGGAQQLTSEAEAGALRTIAGIVGYDGTDGSEVVAAVRKRVLTCASCDCEDVLHEIREIVDYSPDMGDSGLADAVRGATSQVFHCTYCIAIRDDLLKACGIPAIGDSVDDGEGWDVAAAAAIQEIAHMEYRRDHLLSLLTKERDEGARLRRDTATLREDFERALQEIETVSAKLTLAEQSRDEWEQRAVHAEANVEKLEAELELRNLEGAPAEPCASTTYLLDIALRALRGDGPDADQLATLIDAARGAA